jgi:photosystem II stability/assembly factor-like uncharacterized protein
MRPQILLLISIVLGPGVAGPGSALAQPAQGRAREPSTAKAAPAGPRVEPSFLRGLKARSIGPAIMGGRVSDIALDPKDPFTFYVALGTGGVMKTADNGVTFDAVFAKEAVAAVGALAVSPADPKVVWVGTGEANDRNSSSWGNGVYRSTDGGATWKHAGLEKSRTIARVVVHPTDANTAWVAAMGDLWQSGGERGLYKTTDGGATWKAVLTAPAPYDNRVGCGDVALDPSDPSVLYAALYARQRTPWSFVAGTAATDGKDLGGIYKSTDGGTTWKKLAGGLPGMTGRIGLDVYRKDPRTVVAIVQSDEGGTTDFRELESKRGGVFRSDDGGATWARLSPLDPRPFYFSQIRIDPGDAGRVYVLGFSAHVSEDGGRTFREDLFAKIHPDWHAMAIDPRDPRRIVVGTDGGAYQTYNRGKTVEFLNRFAAGEFYRINVDLGAPYRVCGGLQDNLNWVGPKETRSKEGILNTDWINVGGGDGFYCVFDPDDPSVVYTESQQGSLHRFNLANGELRPLRPAPAEGQPAFRFHWNAPLIGSRHEKGALYLAGNRIFKLAARGEEWKAISPDLSAQEHAKLTTVGSGAENYGVVYTLAQSPVKAGLLWAGTDDGKLWITEDDGGSWNDLTASLPPPAKGQWLSRVEAGAHDAKVAYLAVDAHRTGGFAPLAWRTADGGRTWQSIAGDLPADGPVKLVREDPKNPSLLYAGTEFGLFVSFDRGGRWLKLGGLPTVAVDDILVHPRDLDLVVATHGRSLYILDDLRALQELNAEVLAKEAHLFPPRPALGTNLLPGWGDWSGQGTFRGENPPPGALMSFYLREPVGESVKITIANAAGGTVANLTAPGIPGIGRVSWDLKPTKDLLSEYRSAAPRFVPPGEYTVTLKYGGTKQEQKLRVEIAPGIETR